MYASTNPKTKKALREQLEAGDDVRVFQPGPFNKGAVQDGKVTLEGPHYPEPHKWYATAMVKDGLIVAGSVK